VPFADESAPVEVVDYRPSWPAEFAALAGALCSFWVARMRIIQDLGRYLPI
jgi:hypothetical protein